MKAAYYTLIFLLLAGIASAYTLRAEYSQNYSLSRYFIFSDISPYIFSSGGSGYREGVIVKATYLNSSISEASLSDFGIAHILDGEKISRIEIYNNQTKVSSNILSFCNNNNICEPCTSENCPVSENSLVCSDCRQNETDGLCIPKQDKICDPDCTNIDSDCIKKEYYCTDYSGKICGADQRCLSKTIKSSETPDCCLSECINIDDEKGRANEPSKNKTSFDLDPKIKAFAITILILLIILIIFFVMKNKEKILPAMLVSGMLVMMIAGVYYGMGKTSIPTGLVTDEGKDIFQEHPYLFTYGEEKNANLLNALISITSEFKKKDVELTPELLSSIMATLTKEVGGSFLPVEEYGDYCAGPGCTYRIGGFCRNEPYSGGCDYKGRGYIQITHDYNYKTHGGEEFLSTSKDECDCVGKDYCSNKDCNPAKALEPEYAARIFVSYYLSRGLVDTSNKKDFEDVGLNINGGREYAVSFGKIADEFYSTFSSNAKTKSLIESIKSASPSKAPDELKQSYSDAIKQILKDTKSGFYFINPVFSENINYDIKKYHAEIAYASKRLIEETTNCMTYKYECKVTEKKCYDKFLDEYYDCSIVEKFSCIDEKFDVQECSNTNKELRCSTKKTYRQCAKETLERDEKKSWHIDFCPSDSVEAACYSNSKKIWDGEECIDKPQTYDVSKTLKFCIETGDMINKYDEKKGYTSVPLNIKFALEMNTNGKKNLPAFSFDTKPVSAVKPAVASQKPTTNKGKIISDEVIADIKKFIDANQCKASFKLISLEDGREASLNENDVLDAMSTFKAPVAALYLMTAQKDTWNEAQEDLKLMLEISDNDATVRMLNRILKNTKSSSAIDLLNKFTQENGLKDTFTGQFSTTLVQTPQSSKATQSDCFTYDQANKKKIIAEDCYKVTSARDLAEFYRRLFASELAFEGKKIEKDTANKLILLLEKKKDYGISGKFRFGERNIFYTKSGSYAHNPSGNTWPHDIYNDAGIINTDKGDYVFSVMTMDCGEVDPNSRYTRNVETLHYITEQVSKNINPVTVPDAFGCSDFLKEINGKCLATSYKESRGKVKPDCVVLHYSASNEDTPKRTDEVLRERKLSVHYIIGRNCEVIQEVPDEELAYHAGCRDNYEDCPVYEDGSKPDCLCSKTCPVCSQEGIFTNPNQRCIGIEIDNLGFTCNDIGRGKRQCSSELTNKYNGLKGTWELYPDAQIDCLANLVCKISKKNNIPITRNNIVGHEEIITQKSDPGPAFDWDKFMALVKNKCAK